MTSRERPLPRLIPWKVYVDHMCADGAKLRPLAEVLGEADGYYGFSDYRVDDAVYATSTLYLTTERHWDELAKKLEAIRAQFGVESRALQYKHRHRWARRWPGAVEPWLTAFRETPGLVICIARTRRLAQVNEYRDGIRDVAEQLRQGTGLRFSWKQLEALVWKLAPFFIAAPLLRRGVLGWYSDFDAILQGQARRLSFDLLQEYLDYGGAGVTFMAGIWEESGGLPAKAELALSLPDLVSGILADHLTSPFVAGPVDMANDPPGATILGGLAGMGNPFLAGGPPCRLYVGMLDRTETGTRYEALDLTRTHRASGG